MKILDSQTRIKILRALKKRNKTLSELSRELGYSKSTLSKHLTILQSEGIVSRIVNGNKFIYYKLTEKGREIVEVLVSFVLSLAAATLAYLGFTNEAEVIKPKPMPVPTPTPLPKPAGGFTDFVIKTTSTSSIAAAILTFIFLFVIILFSLRLYRRQVIGKA
jgi:DNA-binding MarR family transcriptional regulator